MEKLFEKLDSYSKENYIPMHMPGHKRNVDMCGDLNAYAQDITEIDGFDNYHHPTDIIKDEQARATLRYNSKQSYYLINGSSCGVMAAISTVARHYNNRKKIVIARNCHKSVYNAIYLNSLEPIYVYPEMYENTGICKAIDANKVEDILKKYGEEICAVVITSPTYEGIVSDISRISEVAHDNKVSVIVDSAHGAHFYFNDAFPKSALYEGADIVIESLHKTLPALTQTAIIHIGKESVIKSEELFFFLDMYQSTSPSYILMSSISKCFHLINEENYNSYCTMLMKLRNDIESLENITLFKSDDPSKIVIMANGMSGKELYDELLLEYKIQLEMASLNYVIAMTSVADKEEYYEHFIEALRQIDKKCSASKLDNIAQMVEPYRKLDYKIAMDAMKKNMKLCDSEGEISAGFVFAYPPGSPIIAPGEVFDKNVIELIKGYKDLGIEVVGADEDIVTVIA